MHQMVITGVIPHSVILSRKQWVVSLCKEVCHSTQMLGIKVWVARRFVPQHGGGAPRWTGGDAGIGHRVQRPVFGGNVSRGCWWCGSPNHHRNQCNAGQVGPTYQPNARGKPAHVNACNITPGQQSTEMYAQDSHECNDVTELKSPSQTAHLWINVTWWW